MSKDLELPSIAYVVCDFFFPLPLVTFLTLYRQDPNHFD